MACQVRPSKTDQRTSEVREGELAAWFVAEDLFVGAPRLLQTVQHPQGVPEGFAGTQVVGPVADRRLEQGDGLRCGEPGQSGRGEQ